MPTTENARRRLQAWKNYRTARQTYFNNCQDLRGLGALFVELGEKLSHDGLRQRVTGQELSNIPDRKESAAALEKYQQSVVDLQRARIAALHAGFKIADSDLPN